MRRTKVRLLFLFLLMMPVLPSNGVGMTMRFLPIQVWSTNGRLNQVETDQFPIKMGDKRNMEWGEWLFIVERQ